MEKRNISYWLTLEPYVFISISEEDMLAYNTLDGKCIESFDPEIVGLIKSINNEENGGVILVESEKIEQENISQFIYELRENFMGDIIECSLSDCKPIQLYPILNLQENMKRYKHESDDVYVENTLPNLHEITLYLENPLCFPFRLYPYENSEDLFLLENKERKDYKGIIQRFIDQAPSLESVTFNIVMKDLFSHPELEQITEKLENLPGKKKYFFHYSSLIGKNNIEVTSNSEYIFCFSFPLVEFQWEECDKIIQETNMSYSCSFLIHSENEQNQALEFIEKYTIKKYEFIPIYDKKNKSFFEDEVYLTKEDILNGDLSMREIFINQSVNVSDFGKLSVLPDGKVYANMFMPAIGDINHDIINKIIYEELSAGKSWLRTRVNEPCKNCLYQWLCPSPSNYELIIGKNNLCHVKP